jgi:2',3'-cyclic-nucleotide 2'-phosphodiesterase (5'-nucleotidase family)
MGYDVVTLGNHEFDLGPHGLSRIITSAHRNGGIPEIVFSNVIFDKQDSEDETFELLFAKGSQPVWIIKICLSIRGFLGDTFHSSFPTLLICSCPK